MVSRKVLNAVFPVHTYESGPTPAATPTLGGSSFVSFGSQDSDDLATRKIRRERAWHAATAFLTLQERPITFADAGDEGLRNHWQKRASDESLAGISCIASQEVADRNLVDWYSQEVARHYVTKQLPLLEKVLAQRAQPELLGRFLGWIEFVQDFYFQPIQEYVLLPFRSYAEQHFKKLKANYYAILSTSLYNAAFPRHLAKYLKDQGSLALASPYRDNDESMALDVPDDGMGVREILGLAQRIGLGGSQAQRVFAEVMDELLVSFVKDEYAGQVTNSAKTPDSLRRWIDQSWSVFARKVVECLSEGNGEEISDDDVQSWEGRAIQELASLRLKEAFDIVVDWQNSQSGGGLLDLAVFNKSTAGRALLTNRFASAISHRLLQPGASTTEILQVYTHIIMAFVEFDTKGVLLERVSRPIRRYLREREDTVRIIIQGLLIDPKLDSTASEQLLELAKVLADFTEQYNGDDEAEQELFTMNWTPDPVDAGPEYQGYNPNEIIGNLIGIFESKDVFVKEFQTMLSDSLLRGDGDFSSEIQVLELFKKRFGEAPLQACEVMLKDLGDSRRTDEYIKKQQQLGNNVPDITTKILSRLYWPPLHSETFVVPAEIAQLQEKYAAGFEQYKPSRKLTWLPALGRVKIQLELEDRSVEEEVQTWQASVIYAFQDGAEAETSERTGSAATRTRAQLVQELEMDEDMVQAALTFWVGKLVLVKDENSGSYSVIERLPTAASGTGGGAAGGELSSLGTSVASVNLAAAAAAASASAAATELGTTAVRSESDMAEEKMAVYWMYIVNMLTNQGAMPLQRIVMMLKFVVPGGGFTYGNDELRAYLAKRIGEGKIEMVGGNYKIVKGTT